MNTTTKNLLIAATLSILSISAFSQVTDMERRTQDRRDRYQERFRDLDICVDIKKNLVAAEDAFMQFDRRIENLTRKIESQSSVVNQRVYTLESKKNAFHQANSQVAELTQLKKDKPRLTREHTGLLASANAAIPGATQTYRLAKEEKDRKCTGLGWSKKCRKAKKARDRAEDALNALKRQKTKSERMLQKLATVETDLSRVSSILVATQNAFIQEQNIMPSISELQTTLRQLKIEKQNQIQNFQAVEEEYAKLEFRLDKCETMKYQAKKGIAFKKALIIFAENSRAGCSHAVDLISGAQGKAQKDGISEAYDLVCESDIFAPVVQE